MESKRTVFLREAVRRGYRFNENDNVINRHGKVVLGSKDNNGYLCFGIKIGKETHHIAFHRLKAFLLFGEAMFLPRIQVRHLNGNPGDWSDTNIVLGTQSQNMMDRPKPDRIRCATIAASYVTKVTKHQREEIRELYKNTNITMLELAIKYGLKSKGTVCMIINKTGYYKNDRSKEEQF